MDLFMVKRTSAVAIVALESDRDRCGPVEVLEWYPYAPSWTG